jgi:hypothetical protein
MTAAPANQFAQTLDACNRGNPSIDKVVRPLDSKAGGRRRRYREPVQPVRLILLPRAERLGYPQ